jgi:hypothetical protein
MIDLGVSLGAKGYLDFRLDVSVKVFSIKYMHPVPLSRMRERG